MIDKRAKYIFFGGVQRKFYRNFILEIFVATWERNLNLCLVMFAVSQSVLIRFFLHYSQDACN